MAQANEKNITLSFFIDPDTNIHMKWSELIYSEALTRLNIKFSYIVLPAIRASLMADLGKIDGEIVRGETYGDEHPNLIRIEEPITVVNLSAFAHDSTISLSSWEAVKNSHYKIEYYRGQHLAGQRLSQYVSADRLTNSSSPTQSLRKLLRGRIDVYIGTEQIATGLLATPEFIDSDIKMLTRLESISAYGYLNKRHSDLAITLADVFKQMKSEGKFDAYYHQAQQYIEAKSK
ncbi:hypothetical protein HQQ94_17375 [Shewanella sp. VB17]|uniref:substrate-binding periplasmic protein n=1 Tax=Shewanella sp. VB17 TaxID=2739432 RepID=UPI00156562BC|nr:hypothetical protein [Shewanella sp. VB17]NRD74954.1 hypothetical protein [Shewanella sp. VB17]